MVALPFHRLFPSLKKNLEDTTSRHYDSMNYLINRAGGRRLGLLWRACFVLLLSASAQLWAQNTGTISGRVSNQATGDLLTSAIIRLEGSTITAVSDRGGVYSIQAPAGLQTLVVSYTGLDTMHVPINVVAGQTVNRDIALTSDVYSLEAVSVTGLREGNALAIQQQRLAPNPKTVVAVDTFGNPPANPGELLQRMPGITTDIVGSEVRTLYIRGMGPGFSSFLVDGDQMASSTGTSASRDYQIEQMGTGNVESVELIKAPTPDQDANAIAGYVNLVTRRSFDTPGRRIGLTAGVMWRQRGFSGSPFQDRADNLDLVGVSFSDVFSVFGRDNNLGVAINFNRRISATTQDEMGTGGVHYTGISQPWLNPLSANPLARLFGTGDFGYEAVAHNVGFNVDYKLNDAGSYAYFKFALNSNYQYQEYYRPAYGKVAATIADFEPGSTYEHSILLPSATSIGITESSLFHKKSLNYSFTGGTQLKLFDNTSTLDFRLSWSHANISYPGWIRTDARTSGIGFEIDRRGQDPWYPIFNQTAGPSIYDPASYRMNSIVRNNYKAPNDLYGARLDFRKDFATVVPTHVKVGVKYNDSQREAWRNYGEWTYVGADGVPNTADDVMTPYSTVSYKQGDGRYGPFPFMTIPNSGKGGDPLKVPDEYWALTAANVYNSYANSNQPLEFREKISAAYIQGNIDFGKLRVLGGVRVEKTETEATAWLRNTNASWGGNSVGGASLDPAVVAANLERARRSFVEQLTTTGDYQKVFPGIHFIYEPLGGLLVRASYNRSIARPPIAALVATIVENPDTQLVTMGNPNLRPYISDNFEVGMEKYFEPIGLISAGVFLKEISDYFRSFDTPIGPEGIDGTGLYAGYTLRQNRNVGDARIRGFEINYQQEYRFLPGFWGGLGSFANFTYQDSVGNYGGTTSTNQLANLAPRSGNAGISWVQRGIQARLLANWTDRKYTSTNGGVDVYFLERLSWDLKLQYRINRTYDVFLDVTNLTDEAPRTNVSGNGVVQLHHFMTNQGVGFVAGVKARF